MKNRNDRKKDARRELIIGAAEALFLEKGYQNASMNDLADKADFTKKTLYSYFVSKEDLYFAVIARWYERLLDELKNTVAGEGTALDRIIRGCKGYTELYRKDPVIFSMMNSLETVRLTGSVEDLPGRKRLLATKAELFPLMFSIFDEGKREGSIRTDIATKELVTSFIFNLTGFFYILSANGANFTRFFGLGTDTFVETSVGLIVDSIKNRHEN